MRLHRYGITATHNGLDDPCTYGTTRVTARGRRARWENACVKRDGLIAPAEWIRRVVPILQTYAHRPIRLGSRPLGFFIGDVQARVAATRS